MPMLSSQLWQAEQNTKIPAETHWLSYRALLNAANTTQPFTIPSSFSNPAQVSFPGIQPTGEPQQGRRFFVTKLVVRDANGALGGTAGGSIALNDSTTSTTIATTGAITTTAPYIITQVTQGTGVVNPNDTIQIVYTAPTSGTATATGFTVDVFGYWQQGI